MLYPECAVDASVQPEKFAAVRLPLAEARPVLERLVGSTVRGQDDETLARMMAAWRGEAAWPFPVGGSGAVGRLFCGAYFSGDE